MEEHRVLIAPSVLSADFLRLGEELDSIATADAIHYDVMDGHFVPNVSFGLDIAKQVKGASELPLDVHLMVDNPDEAAPTYARAGADMVTVHVEAARHIHRIVGQVHDAGAKAGAVINPGTPVSALEAILPELDMVLVMSVDPGFGGQSFIPATLAKLRELKALAARLGCSPRVEVDGGISAANAREVVAAGADVLVAGSSVFKAADRAKAIADIRAQAALAGAREA
jgi:ribulose-phosphate 3-epimerase